MAAQSEPQDAQIFTLPDGRNLGYAIYGSPRSPTTPTIFYFHGFPGARVEGSLWVGSSISPNIVARCITIDRPGMGLSNFQPNRKVLDFPRDVLALADHLQIEKFHIMGASGGSPYALACAKEIPKTRLISTAVISGLYPGTQEGMLFKIRALLFVGYWVPTVIMARVLNMVFGKAARDPDPKAMEEFLMKEMQGRPAADLKCLENGDVRRCVAGSMKEAFRQGGMGVAWDCRLYSDWGFELREVDGKDVTLWHGKEDINTPVLMAELASKEMKRCLFKVFENETHMSVPFNHVEEILNELLKL